MPYIHIYIFIYIYLRYVLQFLRETTTCISENIKLFIFHTRSTSHSKHTIPGSDKWPSDREFDLIHQWVDFFPPLTNSKVVLSSMPPQVVLLQLTLHIECPYNAVSLLEYSRNDYKAPYPILWVQILLYAVPESLQCFMECHVMSNRVKTGPDCIYILTRSLPLNCRDIFTTVWK